MKCAICGIRKPRRFCPGVAGETCTICCGTERENTITCPLTCPFLLEAHRHEKVAQIDPTTLPNQDVRVTEEFVSENEMLLAFAGSALFEAALQQSATDYDVREALAALVQTYRTAESGLIYESRPANAFAAEIAEHVQRRLTTVREKEVEARGVSTIRDAAILGVLVFLQRMEYMQNNGRAKSKAYLDFLGRFALAPVPGLSQNGGAESAQTIVQPDEPLIIL